VGINPKQLRELVIRPACEAIGLYSLAAEELLLGTACQESKCGTYLKQLGTGPALGIFQMEPRTHDDLWKNFVRSKDLGAELIDLSIVAFDTPDADEMVWNLKYAAAMCRVHYYRVKAPLPAAGDIPAQAAYWKKYYNTIKGAGTVEEYLKNWKLTL
jgi:hypothetical protein